jgi:hypothetical protein
MLGLGLLIIFSVLTMNGLSFLLIAFLVAFFNYIASGGDLTITFGVELMALTSLLIVMTALCFRQLTFFLMPFFEPRLNSIRLGKYILVIIFLALEFLQFKRD